MKTSLTALFIAALIVIECLAGGTRVVYSLPAYALLALAGILVLARRPDATSNPSAVCLAVSSVCFSYILLRAAYSPIEYLWWKDFYMVLGCLVAYLLTSLYLTGERQRTAVVWGLLALAVIEIFIGLRQFSVGDNWMPFGWSRTDSGRRASGTLISSIHLAGYLEVVGLFGLSYAIWSTWKSWARILAGYIAGMCYLGVAITGSRGGYLSSMFSLLVFGGLSWWTVRKVRRGKVSRTVLITSALAFLVFGGAVALMSQSPFLNKRLSMISEPVEKNAFDIRFYNWQAAIDQFRTSPWLGTGAGTHLYYGRFFRRPQLQSDPIHAHSDYLELLAEYGIVGSVGVAAFLLVHLAVGWRNYRAVLRRELSEVAEWQPVGHNSLALYIGALSAISAYLAHSVTDFNLHVPGHALIFAFIFGVIASPVYGPPPARAARSALIFRWALSGLALWLFISFLLRFPNEYWTEKARLALGLHDYPASIAAAEQALTFDDRNPELFLYLGGAWRGTAITAEDYETRVRSFEAGVEAYRRGLSLFPQDVHMLIRLGQTLGVLGRFKEAEDAFRAAVEHDRNFAPAHAYYARHLAVVGRDEEAEARVQKAIHLENSTPIHAIVRGTSLDAGAIDPS